MDGSRLTNALLDRKRRFPYKGEGSPHRDSINVLDCVFGCAWFPTFEALARHMTDTHQNPVTVPRRFRTRQEKREALERIDSPMPRKSTRKTTPARPVPSRRTRGGLPKPSSEGSTASSPFLKAADIGRRIGATATLKVDGKDARIVDGNYGEQLIIDVTLNGKSYAMGITLDSVNYRLLFDRFGANPKNWRGSVKVTVKESRQGNLYVAVVN